MKIKLIMISIILLLVMVFACGCIPFMENIGLINPTDEEQLSPEKGGPPDGLVKVLIGFKEKPGATQQAMVKGVGGQIKYTYHIVDAIAASIPEKAIEALQKNPNVRYVEPDGLVYALDVELDNSWGVDRIDAEEVWTTSTGLGVKVAIIDSGIDKDHPDLTVIGGENFVSKPSWKIPIADNWDDDYGHGTHVAGIVAALDDNTSGVVGVAPDAELYALKVLDRTGRGNYSDVISALEWCMDKGIHVTNNSYGSSGDPGQTVKEAFDDAYYDYGIIHVAAAGNGGAVIYPAAYLSVIAVSATNSADELAWFSSTGPEVELAAPGVDIYSTYKDGGYATYSGTSMASPHVAGVAALVIASGISGVEQIRSCLTNSAENINLLNTQQGSGLVDAENAVFGTTHGDDLPPTATGTISGTVTDIDTKEPIEGGLVTANEHSTSTDANGIYTLADLPVDSYTVTASAEGYSEEFKTADVLQDETTDVDFTLTPETTSSNTMHVSNIEMSSDEVTAGPNKFYTAIATVTIVDENDAPVGGATVYGTWSEATSDTDSGVTNDIGIVSLESNKVKNPPSGKTFTFSVDDVEKVGWTYDSNANVETSDSITVP